jgi:protein SCO1/2/putative membrane protein
VISSYRLGILIVLTVVLISAGICLARVDPWPASLARAGQDLGAGAFPLGEFQLVERSGRPVTQTDLADRLCIASFIFTRCPLSCPRITGVMKSLHSQLAATRVLLLSLTVDPEHDTPAVLTSFARAYDASPDRWWFLTGRKSSIYALVRERFKLNLEQTPAGDSGSAAEAISHSDRLALVDHGKVVGLFDSTEPAAVDALLAEARLRALPRWVQVLPTANATLNALCAVLLLAGWRMIRRYAHDSPCKTPPESDSGSNPATARRALEQPLVRAHATAMVLAFSVATLFLSLYLTYHFQAGSVRFRGGGPIRLLYFTTLLSHSILAAFGVVPLAVATLLQALRHKFDKHVLIAGVTFPIWLFVSVTGVVIYAMLYHMHPGPAGWSWDFSRHLP